MTIFLSSALMTLRTTICFMSQVSEWPRGVESEKLSPHTNQRKEQHQISKIWGDLPTSEQNGDHLSFPLSKPANYVNCLTFPDRAEPALSGLGDSTGSEISCFHGWVIFAVTSSVAMINIFVWPTLDIKAYSVSRRCFTWSFPVWLNGFIFSCDTDWSKSDDCLSRFQSTKLPSLVPQRQYLYH